MASDPMLTLLPTDTRLPRLVDSLAERYEFLALLGQGGSGTVYEVRNLQLNRMEALKVLSPSFPLDDISQRFIQEAKVAASLDHPRIVKIYDFGHDSGIYWYSMQLVDGPTLADLIESGRTLDQTALARMAVPIMDALAYSHERGVVHRDIKPANILFSAEGRPFLTDFGIAKTTESTLHTHTGRMMGTPAYVAPEQALGERVDARADQYALGITLYKALTGCLPFAGDEFLQTLVQRLNQPPTPIQVHAPQMAPALADLIMRALERDREARWPSIAAMKEALLEACGGAGIDASGPLGDLSALRPGSQPLSISIGGKASSADAFAPTADLPTAPPRSKSGRWVGLAAVLLLGMVWVLWRMRPTPARASTPAPVKQSKEPEPPPPRPMAISPAPAPSRPAAIPSAPRRPMTYPQLLEEASPVGLPAALPCAGSRVTISLDIREDGTVKACRVISPARPECAEAARTLGMRYRFKPAMDAEGKPIATTVAATIDFPEMP
ncbi:protein kinase domain-containing protein [Holophaga foetida]|uniref:protein kinase domain-containing protein n=1 Tax=Holophaga foetida TaxID=35839 RepID=UPI0002473B39|nr:protein kinase [Holophaga foetida]